MSSKVTWSSYSQKDVASILEYLALRWNNKIAENFVNILDENIKRIVSDPERFPFLYKSLKIRKCVITKHNVLYYKKTDSGIYILRIYDTRQNPGTLKF